MLFLLLTAAFAETWHREVVQESSTTCLEVTTALEACVSLAGPALTGAGFSTGSCTQTDACSDSASDTFSTILTTLNGFTNLGCSDIETSLKCSGTGTLPNPGDVDLSGCDLTNIDIQNVMTCVPTKCEDFQTGGCASSSDLTDCIKAVYAEGLQCDGLIQLPNLDTCGENPLACVDTENCDMSKCSAFEQFGCASCVTECVTSAVGQSFQCNFAEQITAWAGDNGFQIPTGCDVSCLADDCQIPTDCNDYAAKVSAEGCASCLADCARDAVADSIDGCHTVQTTWSTTNFDTCSTSTDVASCVTQNCAMPKNCNDYETTVSSGGCAACLGDCARQVVAQSIDNCDAILTNLGNNNGSAGALSLVLALVGSILYHF